MSKSDPYAMYDNPLVGRYASQEMSELFGPRRRIETWRRLWVILAESQAELGLPITEQQIAEMKSQISNIDWEKAAEYERRFRHDVMAHVHAFGDVCPSARGIIHLGATSCYVTDNTDLILMREGLKLIARRLAAAIDHLGTFAAKYRDLPCLSFTHFQPAQPTTVGRRACLWAYDFAMDLQEVEHRLSQLQARGVQGTTGTQASFLTLFNGDHEKVKKLNQLVCQKMGFPGSYVITGQTYSRKIDAQILATLAQIAATAHKVATDIRLLAHRKEIEEPFEKEQIGSSAMAYKRNPMRSERICGLARYVMSLEANTTLTHGVQWLERTLDDSANRRLVIPQAFLAIDAILILCCNVFSGLVVYPKVIEKNLLAELPFMMTEDILMAAVQAGGDRQELHERIRQHSHQVARKIKEEGGENDLIERLKADPAFAEVNFESVTDPLKYVGRSREQVDEFIRDIVQPIRERYTGAKDLAAEVQV
ncbi:MAG TPA: adenylosuccinate lyase [Thermogutta sp.]|nr:adenylosuccinate lyase [Thermogutta sp.]